MYVCMVWYGMVWLGYVRLCYVMLCYVCTCVFFGSRFFPLKCPSFLVFGAAGNPQQHLERVSVDLQHGDLITMEAVLLGARGFV